MTFGKTKRRAIGVLAALAALMVAQHVIAGPDPAELIAAIKVPVPATIDFTEIRFSRLLKKPTVVGGQLSYLGPGKLDRVTERPFHERTEIRIDSVKIIRDGEATRSFALDRAPELKILLRAFSSLLSGDLVELNRDFEMTTDGSNDKWTLILRPTDPRVRSRLDRVAIEGKRNAPDCFSIYTQKAGVSVMLLGATAEFKLPAQIDLPTLQAACRANSP